MRVLISIEAAAIVALAVGSAAGCIPMAVGAGTGVAVAHSKGNLEVLVEGTPSEVVNATEAAFRDLRMSLVSRQSSDRKTVIVGQTPENRKVRVKVKDRSKGVTKLSIRVGTFGRKLTTYTVYDKILEKLEDPTVARASP